MQGHRIYNPDLGSIIGGPGDYWYDDRVSGWMCNTPNGLYGSLTKHDVIEHEDGTITVSPSILVEGHDGQWHGYLERGVWREV